jgi:hypothetical protein
MLLSPYEVVGSVGMYYYLDGIEQVKPLAGATVEIYDIDPIPPDPKIPGDKYKGLLQWLLDMVELRKKAINKNLPHANPDLLVDMSDQAIQRKLLRKKSNVIELVSLPPVRSKLIADLKNPDYTVGWQNVIRYRAELRRYFVRCPHKYDKLFKKTLLDKTFTDKKGHFECPIPYNEAGDKPDIYINVKMRMKGSPKRTARNKKKDSKALKQIKIGILKAIYKPSIICGTHWDYVSGTQITIRIKYEGSGLPLYDTAPIDGQVVWMKTVNGGTPIRNIMQFDVASAHLDHTIGLTNSGPDYVCPFGGAFSFVLQFGSGFPGGKATHYRWWCQRIKDADLNEVYEGKQLLQGAVSKSYTYESKTSRGATIFLSDSYLLGPIPLPQGSDSEAIYKIPPFDPAVIAPGRSHPSWDPNTATISVDTTKLKNGLYRFTFELVDEKGKVVPLDKDVFCVHTKSGDKPDPPNAPTITACGRTENYLIFPDKEYKKGSVLQHLPEETLGFHFWMRIDNDPCYALINDTQVDENKTDPKCGFVEYADLNTSMAVLSFEAKHPHNFATYSFTVRRGHKNPAGMTDTGGYLTQTTNGYSMIANIYTKTHKVSEMFGEECKRGAFVESLSVNATHTNGNDRIEAYDRGDTYAFAIVKADKKTT